MLKLVTEQNAVLLPVKVVPGASQTRLLGEWDGRLKIAVTARPEKGKANSALTAFLAALLNVRRSSVIVVAGHTSSRKTVKVVGVSAGTVCAAVQTEPH